MKKFILIEVDPTPGGGGLPDLRTPVAISSRESALRTYCAETFGKPIGKPETFTWDKWYEIEGADMVICHE